MNPDPIELVERELRAARPTPPALTPERADSILANAIAESRSPARSPRLWPAFTAAAITACAAVIILMLIGLHLGDNERPGSSAISPRYRKPSYAQSPRREKSQVAMGPDAPARSAPVMSRRSRHFRTPHGAYHVALSRRRIRRASPRLVAGMSGNRDRNRAAGIANFPADELSGSGADSTSLHALLPYSGAYVGAQGSDEYSGPMPAGSLVLIVSDPPRRQLDVEAAVSTRSETGFAKVTAYQPIGPGGGILTQCTVRESVEQQDQSTAQYGLIVGQPVSRLAAANNSYEVTR